MENEENILDTPTQEADIVYENVDKTADKVNVAVVTGSDEPMVVEQTEVTLDDLDDVAPINKVKVIVKEDEKHIPKKLTISTVKLGKAYEKDIDGNINEPEQNSKGGRYYKAKLIVGIKEKINGKNIHMFIPSIFYSVNEDGSINEIPTIPKACPDKKLDDNFTSEISKIRNLFCKKKGVEPDTISSSKFLKNLIGMEFEPVVKKGDFKNKEWIKLTIKNFI